MSKFKNFFAKGKRKADDRLRSGPVAETTEGPVRGHLQSKGRIAHFAGIPYAAAPVGDLRWRPPVRPDHRGEHVLDCTRNGPVAFQRALLFEEFMEVLFTKQGMSPLKTKAITKAAKAVPVRESEDCLSLTVRAPAGAKNLPVMVWVHGGDQTDGSGTDPFYNSNALPARGCVLITINYRLGVFGWLTHPELEAESADGVSGNYGLLDQIAALEWVRDNVANFGGDPNQVTIFGESAGGQGVLNLMTAPKARGLFHRAISQSPSDSGRWLHASKPVLQWRPARDAGQDFASQVVGAAPGQIDRLRAMSAGDVNEAYRSDEENSRYFYPTVDGVVLPTTPLTAFARRQQAPVPFMIGYNADEGSLLAAHVHPAGPEFGVRPDDLTPAEARTAFETSHGSAQAVDALFGAYPGLSDLDAKAEEVHFGDHMFGVHVDYASRHHALAGLPVYRYFFQAVPSHPDQTAGAFHAAELTYVFDSAIPMLPKPHDAHLLTSAMGDRWFAFAATGTPDFPGREAWPAYHPETSAKQMTFDRPTSAVTDCPAQRGLDLLGQRVDALNAAVTTEAKVTLQ